MLFSVRRTPHHHTTTTTAWAECAEAEIGVEQCGAAKWYLARIAFELWFGSYWAQSLLIISDECFHIVYELLTTVQLLSIIVNNQWIVPVRVVMRWCGGGWRTLSSISLNRARFADTIWMVCCKSFKSIFNFLSDTLMVCVSGTNSVLPAVFVFSSISFHLSKSTLNVPIKSCTFLYSTDATTKHQPHQTHRTNTTESESLTPSQHKTDRAVEVRPIVYHPSVYTPSTYNNNNNTSKPS